MKTIENTHFIEADLFIIREGNCPLYKRGDIFKLSGNSLSLPQNKSTCIVLVNDIIHELAKHNHPKNETVFIFECSGCGGSIQLECKIYKKDIPTVFDKKDDDETFNLLSNTHFLKN